MRVVDINLINQGRFPFLSKYPLFARRTVAATVARPKGLSCGIADFLIGKGIRPDNTWSLLLSRGRRSI